MRNIKITINSDQQRVVMVEIKGKHISFDSHKEAIEMCAKIINTVQAQKKTGVIV